MCSAGLIRNARASCRSDNGAAGMPGGRAACAATWLNSLRDCNRPIGSARTLSSTTQLQCAKADRRCARVGHSTFMTPDATCDHALAARASVAVDTGDTYTGDSFGALSCILLTFPVRTDVCKLPNADECTKINIGAWPESSQLEQMSCTLQLHCRNKRAVNTNTLLSSLDSTRHALVPRGALCSAQLLPLQCALRT